MDTGLIPDDSKEAFKMAIATGPWTPEQPHMTGDVLPQWQLS